MCHRQLTGVEKNAGFEIRDVHRGIARPPPIEIPIEDTGNGGIQFQKSGIQANIYSRKIGLFLTALPLSKDTFAKVPGC